MPALRSSFLKAVDESGLADHSEFLLANARECVHFFYNKPKMHRDALERLDFSNVYCALPMLL